MLHISTYTQPQWRQQHPRHLRAAACHHVDVDGRAGACMAAERSPTQRSAATDTDEQHRDQYARSIRAHPPIAGAGTAAPGGACVRARHATDYTRKPPNQLRAGRLRCGIYKMTYNDQKRGSLLPRSCFAPQAVGRRPLLQSTVRRHRNCVWICPLPRRGI